MDKKELLLRPAYQNKFRGSFGNEFQSWFGRVLRAIHPPGDFQPIRQTSGDGGIDGFVIGSQTVYQIYAPTRIEELRDAETARKVLRDFSAALKHLGSGLKAWCFVHNHPTSAIGKKTTAAINEVRTKHKGVTIRIYDIESSWQEVARLDEARIAELLGVSLLPDELAVSSNSVPSPVVDTYNDYAWNLSALVGRDSELEEVAKWSRDSDPPMLCVVGPTGQGKSALLWTFWKSLPAGAGFWHRFKYGDHHYDKLEEQAA